MVGVLASAAMFYEKPTTSTTSSGFTCIPSAYLKLQVDLTSTQKQFDKQRKLVVDQR